jgi:hypothetical protein
MGTNSGTLQVLANQLGLALGLLEAELADAGLSDLLAKLGLRLPPELAAATALAAAAEAAATDAAGLAPLLQALATAVEADNLTVILSATKTLIAQIAATVGALGQVETELTAAIASSALTTAQQAQLAGFAETMAERVIDYLVMRRLAESAPMLLATLDLAGLLDHEPVDVATDDPLAVSHTRSELHLDRLGTIVSAPADHLKNVYGWGGPDFDALELFGRLQRLLDATGQVQTHLLTPAGQSPLLEAYILGFQVDDTVTPAGLVVSIRFPGTESFTRSYPLRDPWTIEVDATAAFAEDLRAAITPPFAATLKPPSGTVNATVTAGLHATPPTGTPVVLIGDPGGTRLQADRAAFDVGFAVTWDPVANQATGEPTLSLTLTNGHLIVSLGGADGFLASVLPQTLDVTAAVDAEWRPSTGLVFKSGAALVVTIPVNAQIGPAHITVLDVGLGVDSSALTLGLKLSGDIALGPVAVSVKDVGSAVALGFERGNLGPADLTFRFLQPTGLGLSLDSGVVTGGGFLSFDSATSEYSGVAQLSIEGVGLTALGLVQTKPDVSFLLLIGATFPTPIELGFGFALTGVGGIVGINRSVALDALETAVWKGTAKNLLFPSAPITNAATILGTLDTLFPAAPGRYLFGPTGRITWGEPAIVTGNIGLVMELPEPIRIALFGNVVAQFPLKNPIVVLQVSFAGGVDFGSERLFFDASLLGSRIERYPISGDMSLRSSLSSPKNLALAVGGFNPHFQPPAGFPTLSRLALDISDGPLHLHLAAYLAITTNTFQIGAAIDLKAHVCDCDLAGHFAFDALFVKNPFSFEIDIDASASIAFEGQTFAGIHVSGSLAGPAPWHAKGSASISLLFFSVGVDFDHSWGSPPPPTLPPVDPWTTALAPALAEPASWKCVLPLGVQPVVTLAPATGGGPTLLDPAGEIILDQKAVPLNQPIDCFADTALATPLRFDLAALSVNGTALDVADWITVTDEFAPAQFSIMTDDEKLSAESFVSLVSGMAIGGSAASVGTSVSASPTYDQIILDSTRQAGPRVPYLLPLALQIASASSGPSARAPWRTSGLGTFAAAPGIAPKAALAPAAFAIVSTATLGVAQPAVASTRYTAAVALKDYVAQHSIAPQSVEAVQARAA